MIDSRGVFIVGAVAWLSVVPVPDTAAADKSSNSEAVGYLRALENVRTVFGPFKLHGVATELWLGRSARIEFQVDCQGSKYRVASLGGSNKVSVFDGDRFLSYDGGNSATISTPDRRATVSFAFDPRSLGFSTGLYSDLTLEENIAFHSATNVVISEIPVNRRMPGLIGIELTDRFQQRIRFEIEKSAPYRVHYYSKTIPRQDGAGVFTKYVTESEYWEDQSRTWVPKKLRMYTLDEGREDHRVDTMAVDFDKPEIVTAIDPGVFSISGLSLPFGQPVADLRIHERIGYWNGTGLVKDVPVFERKVDERQVNQPKKNQLGWLIVVNIAAFALLCIGLYWRRSKTPPKAGEEARKDVSS